ncbi:MAG: hypothetical protein AB1801_24010 [Chloroflexota bacterium]
MYSTVEVRWFIPGSIPPEVTTWFHREELRTFAEPARVDYYLHLRDTDGLGIKLRQGQIEVKQRQGQLGQVQFARWASGLVEQWRKWSFSLVGAGYDFSHQPAPAAAWLGVKKERWLRTYRLTDNWQVVPASLDAPGPGCDLELSQVQVGSRTWWSLCLEAFGGETKLEQNLLLVASHVLETTSSSSPLLTVEQSCGYPHWLCSVGEGIDQALA